MTVLPVMPVPHQAFGGKARNRIRFSPTGHALNRQGGPVNFAQRLHQEYLRGGLQPSQAKLVVADGAS